MADLFKNFFKKDPDKKRIEKINSTKRIDEDGRVHIAMHTEVFSSVGKSLLVSNSSLANLVNDIVPCIEPLKLRDKVVVDAYETNEIDDLSKDVVEIAFSKYVHGCLKSLQKQILGRMILFFSFFLLGVGIEILIYGFFNGQLEPMWLSKSLEVLANLFIWQFGGYLAFEFFGARRTYLRYKQILGIKFNIKHWE